MPKPDRLLIQGATVISMDPAIGDLRRGDILIENGRIAAVTPGVAADDCEIIDGTDMVALPGLVDPHRHLWYSAIRGLAMDATTAEMGTRLWPQVAAHYTAEDLHVAQRAGVVDALQHGITTVFDWCHVMNTPEHGPAAVDALLGLPMRVIFGFGASMKRKLDEYAGKHGQQDSWEVARRVRAGELSDDRGLVTMALAVQGPEFTTLEISEGDIAEARALGVPVSMHCGVPAGPPPRRAIAQLADAGLLGPDMQFVHCVASGDDELAMLGSSGAVACVCPISEVAMGVGDPPFGRIRETGSAPGIGTDAVCVSSGDQFDEARTALLCERRRHGAPIIAGGEEVVDNAQLGMTTREALEAITIGAARACMLDRRIGSLTPGKEADVVLLPASAMNLSPMSDVVGMLVCSAHGLNVDTVIVAGNVVKHHGELVDIDVRRIQGELVACRDRLFAAGGYAGMIPDIEITAPAITAPAEETV